MSSFTSSNFEFRLSNFEFRPTYTVFLSFCAAEVRPFVSRLDSALSLLPSIAVFGVDKRFQHGERVESVLNVIGECDIAIIVFSKLYACSSSCIKELEEITNCCQNSNLIAVPVFDDGVYPSRGGLFREAFHSFLDTISKEEISKEEDKFMTRVALISQVYKDLGSSDFIHKPICSNQNAYIEDIVEHVMCVINHNRYDNHLNEILHKSVKSRVQDVVHLLKQTNSPFLLGIWGMTGIGKSTIAQALFHQIGLYFKYRCFLENVGGVWEENNGQVSLQKKLLSYIDRTSEEKMHVSTIKSRRVILKQSFHRKRILLILDNVDKLEQLHALCGSHKWFGEGSKIIILTRDRHLLKEHRVDHIYRVKELGKSESLEVLNRGALSRARDPREDFVEVSRQLVTYCGGLPLALEAIGRLLCGKEVLEWKGVLRSLQRFSIPAPQLLEALEKSFSNLSDEEKHVFLDIAHFFTGMNQTDVLQTLNRPTQSAALQISLLQDKCFVTIDENNKLEMPVLLKAMARDIIKRESSNKTDQPKIYDVFLSFRGEDNRPKFVSHLHSSLQNAGIYVFKDDDEIQRGDQISISLLRAIGQSRISIVVLSTNYANSRWCMLELEKIMEIGRVKSLVVVPVFYEVDPSEVRHQKGCFGKAFEGLISTTISVDKSTKSIWRKELFDIGGIGGFVLVDSRNESGDIKNIVEQVTRLLDRTELFVAEHPVGIESRLQAATKLLNIQKTEDVLFLGIWGMGGMGKTTIAKAIYNQIGSKFEGKSFLLNIREFWETDTNQVSLQQLVLCDVYKTTSFKIRDIESGKNMLKQRLAQKRVLFVLDDVNELDQLKALCGSREWFGSGSRIIITTRDMHLLRSCRVDRVYKIEEMDEGESLELFSWHAFKQPSPIEDFATHSSDVIAYSGRLPLALEVLGSYLFDCEITEWHKVLEKLKCIPHDQVQKKLRVSFDGLKDVTEQQIFLDIACFFIGMDRNDVIHILNGCGFFADTGIKVLVERSLVTVDNRNMLRMHDLLRDMGRQIVYEESPFDPENRSRLWRHEEVFDILSKQKGTEAVKGLTLGFPGKNTVCLNTKAFKKMNKLRLLQLAEVQLNGDFKNLSGDLRWLYWHGFPSTYTPAGFQQGSLVVIELKYSNLKQIWKKNQMLENLKILNLSHSWNLIETPDFSFLPNLEKLILKDCPSLSTVSHSIGSLRKILLINLTDCTGLRKLPRSIYKLKSLEVLILSGCSMIDKLEEDMEQMESLTTLIADKTAITKVPFSIVRSKNIGYISLRGFEGFSRDVFPSIILSWMSPSKNLTSLVQTYVPTSSLGTFKDLSKLRSLCVECGSKQQLSRDVANILDVLKATNYHQLDAMATTPQICNMFPSPLIDDCLGEVGTSGSKNYLKAFLIQMGTKFQVSNIAEDNILQTADVTWDSFLLPCENISDWLNFSCKGCSVIFVVPTMKETILKSMMVFVLYYSSPDNIISEGCHGMLIINYTKTTIRVYKRDTLISFEDGDWQSITSNLEPVNEVEVMIVFGEGFIVEKTTVSLLYDETINQEMENCNAADEDEVIVYGHDDKDVGVSGGYSFDVPVNNNAAGHGQDENISENESDSKNGDAVDKNVSVSGGCNIDVLGSKNVTGHGQDENISEDKHLHAMDKNSGDDAMAKDKKCACCFWWR